jgi:hypothetical protein
MFLARLDQRQGADRSLRSRLCAGSRMSSIFSIGGGRPAGHGAICASGGAPGAESGDYRKCGTGLAFPELHVQVIPGAFPVYTFPLRHAGEFVLTIRFWSSSSLPKPSSESTCTDNCESVSSGTSYSIL